MKAKTQWIDTDSVTADCRPLAGKEVMPGFLLEISPQGRATRHQLRDDPARTNQSREATLVGWCGETDNVSVYACGIWVVVDRSPNHQRAKIAQVTDRHEIEQFLDLVGWPELMPDEDA